MAVALAPHKIRVNAIGPGSIQTQVLQAVVHDQDAKKRSDLAAMLDVILSGAGYHSESACGLHLWVLVEATPCLEIVCALHMRPLHPIHIHC